MNALFLGTWEDKEYLPHLKHLFNGLTTYTLCEPVNTLAQLEMYCTKRQITRIVSTQIPVLLSLLKLSGNEKTTASLDNYAGSLFTYKNLEIVFINPLPQLFTVTYGKFIAARYISKIAAPNTWSESTEFSWNLCSPHNIDQIYHDYSSPEVVAIAVDIETFKERLAIRCVGYTAIFVNSESGEVYTHSCVIPLTDIFFLGWMRKFNRLPAPKIFQNGKYDVSYLLRYNSAPTNWLWDTAHFMHSWYSELPKDLAFLNAFFLRKAIYWKDLAETSDLFEYYRYNALDTWATANVFIQQLLSAPDWAKRNYTLEFPLVFPCLLAEMTGMKRDSARHITARSACVEKEEKELVSIRKMIGQETFNPGSHVQVKKLMEVLGCKDLADSSDEIHLKKAAYRHPLNSLILNKILKIRELRKLRTTYLRTDEDITKTSKRGAKEFHGRILYALNPHGTDTGRLASKEHHFWCGLQIQNIPVGEEVKSTLCAEDGYFFAEADLEQAESRDTAHIIGDQKYIEAVTGPKDFHSVNASAFFGIPYEELYNDTIRKTKNKTIRDLSKRTNHGANYNMGAAVLLDTMGLENVWLAKKLLHLPFNNPIEITQYLIDRFHETYPKLKGPDKPFSPGTYYAWVVREILENRMLVSRAYHHTDFNIKTYSVEQYIGMGDWTRYCFGRPDKSKQDLNSYVAHVPQSLNARTLNEAFMRVFYDIALQYPTSFRLYAQVHDSIPFGYKDSEEGKTHPERVKHLMEIPVTIRDIDGVFRTFTVPAGLKLGKKNNEGELVRAKYWSEIE